MKLIALSKHSKKHSGKYFAQVDDEDYDNLMKWNWHVITGSKTLYVARQISLGGSKQKQIKMHRQLLGVTDPKIEIDHKDHNGLNNQRDNLRRSTKSQNICNRTASGKSKYLGVYYSLTDRRSGAKRYEYWAATIQIEGKQRHLGVFPYTDEGEKLAAKKYDEYAIKYKKEFANLNFKNDD